MDNDNQIQSRKKFIFLGINYVLLIIVFRFLKKKKKKKATTMKMLTQDGKLVEVELSKLSRKGKKIKDGDIHSWVTRKSSL